MKPEPVKLDRTQLESLKQELIAQDPTVITQFWEGEATIDFAVTIYDPQAVGIVTVARNGLLNSGKPTILSLYVLPQFEGRLHELSMLRYTIECCEAEGLVPLQVNLFTDTLEGLRLRELIESISEEWGRHLEVIEHPQPLNLKRNQEAFDLVIGKSQLGEEIKLPTVCLLPPLPGVRGKSSIPTFAAIPSLLEKMGAGQADN